MTLARIFHELEFALAERCSFLLRMGCSVSDEVKSTRLKVEYKNIQSKHLKFHEISGLALSGTTFVYPDVICYCPTGTGASAHTLMRCMAGEAENVKKRRVTFFTGCYARHLW